MHLTRGMCGVSHAAMLGRDFMKLTHDGIRLIQDHFVLISIGFSCTVIFGIIPMGMSQPYFSLCKVYPNGLWLCMIFPRWAKDYDDLPHP